jgi:hypothetical protein
MTNLDQIHQWVREAHERLDAIAERGKDAVQHRNDRQGAEDHMNAIGIYCTEDGWEKAEFADDEEIEAVVITDRTCDWDHFGVPYDPISLSDRIA